MSLGVDRTEPLDGHVRVDLRRREASVAEQLLDETEVRSPVEQVRRRAVPQTVRADVRCVGDMAQQVVDHGADLARVHPAAAPAEGSDTPETPAEEVLFAALEKLFPGQPIRRELDFFSDLGGHSLFAARITSTLRQDPRFAQATVADIYQNRKLGLIAEALQAGMVGAEVAADRPFVLHSAWRRWRCGIAQGLAIPFLVLLTMAQWLAPFFAYHFNTGDADDKISQAVFASVLTFIVAIVLNFAIALFARRVIAGNLKPGSYPLWGLTYYRWWLADRISEAVPAYMINGSPLYAGWLRLQGAKVGPEVNLGSVTIRVPHLVRIGEGASIGNVVNLENARVEGGLLHLGTIDIGAQANVGSYVVIEGDTLNPPAATNRPRGSWPGAAS